MGSLGSTKTGFIVLWTLACLWLPLLVAGWSYAIAMEVRPPAIFETPIEIRILKTLASFGLVILGLSQSLLLVGRVPRPWLWIVAGIAASLIQHAIVYGIFDFMMTLPREYKEALQFLLPYVAIGVGIAGAQACVIGYWRLGGLSWFALTFVAVWLGFVVLVIIDRAIPTFMIESSISREGIRSFGKTLGLWATFGVITGWALWHRLPRKERQVAAAS